MSETSRFRMALNVILVLLLLGGLAGWGCFFFVRAANEQFMASIGEQLRETVEENQTLQRMASELKDSTAQREAEFTARLEELRRREAAIAGREDAATERTQSSFQGLLIQQQLVRNLEALKASLPDMTPEIERLAKEHAQLGAERQRLEKENAELRLRIRSPKSAEGR